jgi:hypothetical protein
VHNPRLASSLRGIPLRSSVLAASGTLAYGVEFKDLDRFLQQERLSSVGELVGRLRLGDARGAWALA